LIVHLSLKRWRLRSAVALAAILTAGLFAPVFVNAQSQTEAQLTVRIQELEAQVRNLTGQLEGLQFSIGQMQTQLQQMADDNEFRFQQLEGGGAGKTEAAPQSGGATPPAEAPQPDTGIQTPDQTALPPVDNPPTAGDVPVISDEPMHGDMLGDSADPLLGQGQSGTALTGTLGESSVPLNLSLDGGTALEDGDARAQYAAGYDAIVRGDYAFAEEQFRQFTALYPHDPQAPDAVNWLGEALLQREAYDEAADVLFTGFESYERSARAPDILLKLGMALAGAGEIDTACRTYGEVAKRYASQPAAFTQKLADERAKANCPA
jgi:tol-pal system protein YbgF